MLCIFTASVTSGLHQSSIFKQSQAASFATLKFAALYPTPIFKHRYTALVPTASSLALVGGAKSFLAPKRNRFFKCLYLFLLLYTNLNDLSMTVLGF